MQRIPCAAIIIHNPSGQVLLNLRDNNPGTSFAGCWTLPGGRVESNETPRQAALRELSEETGLQLPLTFWKVYDRHHPEADVIVEQHIFVSTVSESPKLILGEGQALEFFSKKIVFTLPIAFGFGDLLSEFFAIRDAARRDRHLQIRSFEQRDQHTARKLILAGLGEHFGWIDETRNPDLDDIAKNYLERGYTFLIAEIDGKLVGTGALVTHSDKTGRIVRMSVGEMHRRKGIGRALVERLLIAAREQGFAQVLVGTELNWTDAIGLYKHCGFSEHERDESGIRFLITLDQVNEKF
jgi:8-oxo-dGTP pyrophosphatase MutT (NUDIX family)/GNAT superfamily N-acetyltransferase